VATRTAATPKASGGPRGADARERGSLDLARGPLCLVAAAVVFGLVVLWPERQEVWFLNDASVHRSMVRWAADRIRDGHLPFDGWYPYLSLGASRFHHYQSLPHITTGLLSLLGGEATFRWSLYLLLACWPVAVYVGGRLLGLGPWPAAAAALVSPLLSSAAGLGYEWGSYVWRGSGAWAQLWGMWALPFAWGLSWRAIARGRRLWLAALILGITICAHLLTGYLAMVSLAVFVLVTPRESWTRLLRAAVVAIGALLAAAWMLVPLLMDAGWTVNDEFSRGTFYYDSFGARRIMRWFVTGDLFDARRLPLLTGLLAVGLVVAVVQARRREPPRVVIGLGFVALLLFFGRPTLGPVIDLLPGGGDLFLRRFISGVHLAGLYLIGLGGVYVAHLCVRLARRWTPSPIPAVALACAVAVVLVAPAARERIGYEHQGAVWIDEQARAEATDGVGFAALVERAQELGPGRIFAGLRGPSIPAYRIGQVPGFAALLNQQADGVGFTRPTWSLMSPAEYRFETGNAIHRELFGVRYVILPEDQPIPSAERVAQIGRHVLWRISETTYLDVVDTIAPIAADRRNLGRQMAPYLSSGLYADRRVPTVALGGRTAARPTLGPGDLPARPPGIVVGGSADLAGGVFEGTVDMERPGVVLVKASYDPRFVATVDGAEVPTQMLAPALVGIPVPTGEHEVRLEYHPFPDYLVLFAIGVAAVLGLWFLGRRRVLDPFDGHRSAASSVRRGHAGTGGRSPQRRAGAGPLTLGPAHERTRGVWLPRGHEPDTLRFVADPPRSVSLSRRRQQGHVRIIPFAGTCRG